MIIKSEKLVQNKPMDKLVPEWQIDTCTSTVKHIEETTQFHTSYVADHLRYSVNYNPQRLQRLVDNGKIIEYLDDIETSASKAVDRQVELWKSDSKEYKLAVVNGDTLKQVGLLNSLEAMAKEIVYKNIINV